MPRQKSREIVKKVPTSTGYAYAVLCECDVGVPRQPHHYWVAYRHEGEALIIELPNEVAPLWQCVKRDYPQAKNLRTAEDLRKICEDDADRILAQLAA